MTDPSDQSQDQTIEELRASARQIGVEDVEGKDAEALVRAVREAQGDSTASPANPEWTDDGPRDDVAGDS